MTFVFFRKSKLSSIIYLSLFYFVFELSCFVFGESSADLAPELDLEPYGSLVWMLCAGKTVFMVKLVDIYEDKRSSHLEPITKATVLECQNMVEEFQKKI